MRPILKRGCLITLNAWEGMPMPECALLSGMAAHARPYQPTLADCREALLDCEAEGFVIGELDTFDQSRTWSLTDKGTHKARSLR